LNHYHLKVETTHRLYMQFEVVKIVKLRLDVNLWLIFKKVNY